MKTIFKYNIEAKEYFNLQLPLQSQILKVDSQSGNIGIWALVDTENNTEERSFYIGTTGNPIDVSLDLEYIETFQGEGDFFVGHLFEIKGN